ncbi:MAG: DUF3990 domain-containing protein [Prevotella sp.]|jgi:hypothetical protein|nr:DUF3990 domain-containing protein [Prevotella sp.]
MRVYHGSYMPIIEIDLLQCEPRKDFGTGFYNGFITEFDFDENTYEDKKFKILRFEA